MPFVPSLLPLLRSVRVIFDLEAMTMNYMGGISAAPPPQPQYTPLEPRNQVFSAGEGYTRVSELRLSAVPDILFVYHTQI